jgi:hypothetical protein
MSDRPSNQASDVSTKLSVLGPISIYATWPPTLHKLMLLRLIIFGEEWFSFSLNNENENVRVTCTRDHVPDIRAKFCVSVLDPCVLLAAPFSFFLSWNTVVIFGEKFCSSFFCRIVLYLFICIFTIGHPFIETSLAPLEVCIVCCKCAIMDSFEEQ